MSAPSGPDGGDEPSGSGAGRDQEPLLGRLDPERARERGRGAAAPGDQGPAPDRPQPRPRPPSGLASRRTAVDTRRYQWAVGAIGLVLVLVISVYQFATHGVGSTGVAPGHKLHFFAAPLANTNLIGDANLNPPCTLARHDPRALNICLLARRGPLILSLFVTSGECEQQVNALQTLSERFAGRGATFAAVAVDAGRAATAALIRSHHWTIPVAYDRDGSVGELYGVAVCPMAELARRGGIVTQRLIGNRWQTAQQLAPQVQALLASSGR